MRLRDLGNVEKDLTELPELIKGRNKKKLSRLLVQFSNNLRVNDLENDIYIIQVGRQ